MLAGRTWLRKYTSDDGDLVGLFYIPARKDAKGGYDRRAAGSRAVAAEEVQ